MSNFMIRKYKISFELTTDYNGPDCLGIILDGINNLPLAITGDLRIDNVKYKKIKPWVR